MQLVKTVAIKIRVVITNKSPTNDCQQDSDYTSMTAPEVHIDHLGFYLSSPSVTAKPRFIITVGGFAGAK